MLLHKKHFKAFTLVELLVVISIIVMIAAAVLPTTIDFMKKSRLKGAASMIKMACLKARSQAIAQRERHFVVLYVQANAAPNSQITVPEASLITGSGAQQGRLNTIQIFDSNENDPNRNFESRSQAEELPEFISIQSLGDNANYNAPLVLEFAPTGSITIRSGYTGDLPAGNQEVFTGNQADIVIQQDNGEHIALVDIVNNTGQVHSTIRTP